MSMDHHVSLPAPDPHHAAGCIPNDYWDMGVAVGPLNVPPSVYYPVKLVITGWSDGSSVSSGPWAGQK